MLAAAFNTEAVLFHRCAGVRAFTLDVRRLFPERFEEAVRLKVQRTESRLIPLACEAAHQGYSQVERQDLGGSRS